MTPTSTMLSATLQSATTTTNKRPMSPSPSSSLKLRRTDTIRDYLSGTTLLNNDGASADHGMFNLNMDNMNLRLRPSSTAPIDIGADGPWFSNEGAGSIVHLKLPELPAFSISTQMAAPPSQPPLRVIPYDYTQTAATPTSPQWMPSKADLKSALRPTPIITRSVAKMQGSTSPRTVFDVFSPKYLETQREEASRRAFFMINTPKPSPTFAYTPTSEAASPTSPMITIKAEAISPLFNACQRGLSPAVSPTTTPTLQRSMTLTETTPTTKFVELYGSEDSDSDMDCTGGDTPPRDPTISTDGTKRLLFDFTGPPRVCEVCIAHTSSCECSQCTRHRACIGHTCTVCKRVHYVDVDPNFRTYHDAD